MKEQRTALRSVFRFAGPLINAGKEYRIRLSKIP